MQVARGGSAIVYRLKAEADPEGDSDSTASSHSSNSSATSTTLDIIAKVAKEDSKNATIEAEAAWANKLRPRHPNVAVVFGSKSNFHDGKTGLIMEFLPGGCLQDILRHRNFDEDGFYQVRKECGNDICSC